MASTTTTATAARTAAPRERRDSVLAAQIAFPLALLVIWQVVGMLAGDFYVATPLQAVDARRRRRLRAAGSSRASRRRSSPPRSASRSPPSRGLWIGVTLGRVRFWGKVSEPIALSIYSIPKVTLFPIFLTVFGFGLYSKIAFGMFHGIFPILIIAMNATREVQPGAPQGGAVAAALAHRRRSAR